MDDTLTSTWLGDVYENFPLYPALLSTSLSFDCDVRLNFSSTCATPAFRFWDNACRQVGVLKLRGRDCSPWLAVEGRCEAGVCSRTVSTLSWVQPTSERPSMPLLP